MKKLLIAMLFGVATFFSLSYSVIWIKNQSINLDIGLRYVFVALLTGGYAYLLLHFKLKYAFFIYLLFFSIATIYLVLVAFPINEGFRDLGMVLTWMITLGLGVVIGLLVQLIHSIWKHYNT